MSQTEALQIATVVRDACIRAALEGYEQAQIAGLCQEGAWEVAIDTIRRLELREVLQAALDGGVPSHPRGPSSV